MRILCVEQFAEIAGGQRVLLDLLPAFARKGWKATVLIPGNGSLQRAVISAGASVEGIDCKSYSSVRKPVREIIAYMSALPSLSRSIEDIVHKENIQFVYVNGPRFLPAVAWTVCKNRLPFLFHCHSRLVQGCSIALAAGSLRVCRAHVIGCCHHVLRPLLRYLPRRKLSVIYNGVESVRLTKERTAARITRIGVVGRIEPEKGQEEFVRCARVLTQRFAGISFALAGAPLFSSPAYYERVVEQARGLPVDFLGWQEDLKTLFAGLDLLVVPSKSHEATTRVIPEAFSAGLPVVAFPSGGIPEIVRDGSNGFLAAQPTPAALADRISDVLRMNPADVDIVTGRAHRDWQERFSLPKFQEQVCRLVSVVARQQCW